MRVRLFFVLCAVAAGLGAGSARAAVLICQPAVSSGPQEGKTEHEARALAISAWITEAAKYGRAYTAWRIAAGKLYGCSKTASGTFHCVAKAEPCAVSQVPPPGTFAPRRPQGIDG